MKRILISAIAAILMCSVGASAQTRWGVTGGMNFSTSKFKELDVKASAGWHAGLSCLIDLPIGFSIQPSLVYNQKNSNVSETLVQNVGSIDLPLALQWGPDLLVFRPYIEAVPYIGYGITRDMISSVSEHHKFSQEWAAKERFEYGIGLGGGINVWKVQVYLRYCWNFGALYNLHSWDDFKEDLGTLKTDNENFGGLTFGLSLLF